MAPRRDRHPSQPTSPLQTQATPLPARPHSPRTIASRRVPGCSRPSRGTGWACRRGRSAASAAGSQTPGRPRSRAGKGRTGRSPGPGPWAVSLGCLPLRTHPQCLHPSPLLPGLTRVLTHTELGTQLCCPVSHSLMSVQTWMAGGAEVTAHTHKPPDLPPGSRPLCILPLPYIPPPTSAILMRTLTLSIPQAAVPTPSRWSEVGNWPQGWRTSLLNKMSPPHSLLAPTPPWPSPACWPWRRPAPRPRGRGRCTPAGKPRSGSRVWC